MMLPSRAALLYSLIVAATLASSPAAVSADAPSCPIVANDVIANAVGSRVYGGIMTDPSNPDQPVDSGADQVICLWTDDLGHTTLVTLRRHTFGDGGFSGPAELAVALANLPPEARARVDALHDAGATDFSLPDFQLTAAPDLGDAAVWVFQNQPMLNTWRGGFFVQHGSDALMVSLVGLDDEAAARDKATVLTLAVLDGLAGVPVAGGEADALFGKR
jgi:hypothetical protein